MQTRIAIDRRKRSSCESRPVFRISNHLSFLQVQRETADEESDGRRSLRPMDVGARTGFRELSRGGYRAGRRAACLVACATIRSSCKLSAPTQKNASGGWRAITPRSSPFMHAKGGFLGAFPGGTCWSASIGTMRPRLLPARSLLEVAAIRPDTGGEQLAGRRPSGQALAGCLGSARSARGPLARRTGHGRYRTCRDRGIGTQIDDRALHPNGRP